MKSNIASIRLTTLKNGEPSMKLDMPVWVCKATNGDIIVKLALLGDLETSVSESSEIDSAVKEAVEGFVIAANKFGQGLESELKSLGWEHRKVKNHAGWPGGKVAKLSADKPRGECLSSGGDLLPWQLMNHLTRQFVSLRI